VHPDTLAKHIATLGFIGFIPIAPGTFGTFAAVAVYILLNPSLYLHTLILLLLIPIGIISSHIAERVLDEKDSGHIIIDEFCGYFFSVLFVPFSFGYALAAFFLFRVFDILKPFPIRKIEKLKGGLGIMADDLMAALYTNIILQIWIFIR
jgi:phosphatidylglycerophosphatase A